MTTRLYNQEFDDGPYERDFFFSDYPGSFRTIFKKYNKNWCDGPMDVETVENYLTDIVGINELVEKWILTNFPESNTKKYGLRFKDTNGKLAFILKYL